MDERWDDLKKPVRDAGWGGELNTFPELSVAFWRWAMWKLFEAENAPKRGVVAFITNRKFLTGHPYAGLRKMMRERFDRIDIIDLRGDVRRGERAGVVRDEGVFNIQVGTAITIAVADGSRGDQDAEVFYTDAWAAGAFSRSAKFAWLQEGSSDGMIAEAVSVVRETLDDMRPGPFEGGTLVSLADCFDFRSSGLESKRDQIVYASTKDLLLSQIDNLFTNPDPKKKALFNPTAMNSYEDALAQAVDQSLPRLAGYRPLDQQWHYPHRRLNDRLRKDLTAAWGAENLAIFALPSGTGFGPGIWCYDAYPDRHAFRGSYGGYAFPLFDRRLGGDQLNISGRLLAGLAIIYGAAVDAQDLFDVIITLLSATSYTTTYAEDLEDTFPHIPFPGDHQVFLDAAVIGREIRAVETFARKPGAAFLPASLAHVETIPSAGSLGPVDWADGGFALRPDGTGKVSGVPEAVWRFQVSGYRLLPRWLAAREGQPVDKALIAAMRDVAGRIVELIHWFDAADLVLTRALADTLTRDELGLAPAAAPVAGDEPDTA